MTDEIKEATPGVVLEDTGITSTDGISESFLDTLSDSLKEEACLKDFKDIEGLAKSYVSSQRMLGNSIRIPGPDAGDEDKSAFLAKLSEVDGVVKLPDFDNPEEKNAFFNKLGRPETPEGYEFDFPEGLPIIEEDLKSFTGMAHELGLTKEQAAKIVAFDAERTKEYMSSLEETKAKTEQVLKDTWGPDYSNRMQGAKIAAETLLEKFPEETKSLLNGPEGNNPALLISLSELGRLMQETGHAGAVKSVNYGMSSEEALEQIGEIRGNRNHPFYDNNDPGHRKAVEKMEKLYKIAYDK